MDSVEEWTGKLFDETQAIAHNHKEWSRLVNSMSMQYTHNSSELRDQAKSKAFCEVPSREAVYKSITKPSTGA